MPCNVRFNWQNIIITTMCLAVFFGCQALEGARRFQEIPIQHLLSIPPAGRLHITWEARHLTIAVKGKVRQRVLTINGSIGRSPELRQNTRLDNLTVAIYLTDSAGKVLKHAVLHMSDNPPRSPILHRFQQRIELPKGTTQIAFGYTLEAGGQRFEHNPLKS